VADGAYAYLNGRLATGLLEVTDDLAALDGAGWWAVVLTYEGAVSCARFADVRVAPQPEAVRPWVGPLPDSWTSSLDESAYLAAVESVRSAIAAGTVYQANICRVLSATLAPDADLSALAERLAAGNPAPYGGVISLPDHGVGVVTASPELFLGRNGTTVESRPIKGTAVTAEGLLAKDEAENVMIVDLVRNDLGRVCATGTVEVPSLLALEAHPGLVHLVSTVRGELAAGVGWREILAATFPPGSVTGAPKSSALRIIDELEPVRRGPYCGAVGWVDADTRTAQLAVGIRTFWVEDGMLNFGTGAGITWGSDPAGEWAETELKAARLVALASGGHAGEETT
jgi:para-aminobenzoate synthetase component I